MRRAFFPMTNPSSARTSLIDGIGKPPLSSSGPITEVGGLKKNTWMSGFFGFCSFGPTKSFADPDDLMRHDRRQETNCSHFYSVRPIFSSDFFHLSALNLPDRLSVCRTPRTVDAHYSYRFCPRNVRLILHFVPVIVRVPGPVPAHVLFAVRCGIPAECGGRHSSV